MNFYLLLQVSIKNDNSIDPRPKGRILYICQSPDKKLNKLYNIYSTRSNRPYLFNWPRKKISRSFIEKAFKHKRYLTSIDSDSIEELVDKLRALCGNLLISNNIIIK